MSHFAADVYGKNGVEDSLKKRISRKKKQLSTSSSISRSRISTIGGNVESNKEVVSKHYEQDKRALQKHQEDKSTISRPSSNQTEANKQLCLPQEEEKKISFCSSLSLHSAYEPSPGSVISSDTHTKPPTTKGSLGRLAASLSPPAQKRHISTDSANSGDSKATTPHHHHSNDPPGVRVTLPLLSCASSFDSKFIGSPSGKPPLGRKSSNNNNRSSIKNNFYTQEMGMEADSPSSITQQAMAILGPSSCLATQEAASAGGSLQSADNIIDSSSNNAVLEQVATKGREQQEEVTCTFLRKPQKANEEEFCDSSSQVAEENFHEEHSDHDGGATKNNKERGELASPLIKITTLGPHFLVLGQPSFSSPSEATALAASSKAQQKRRKEGAHQNQSKQGGRGEERAEGGRAAASSPTSRSPRSPTVRKRLAAAASPSSGSVMTAPGNKPSSSLLAVQKSSLHPSV
mmetsp:Transcript_22428/g.35221  ORF Transcript_22428/g.35221 Transcript_22428/m.35221 type:complete len:461 (+) Transcript_22428:2-1384(+)